jgi:hypothetical protein
MNVHRVTTRTSSGFADFGPAGDRTRLIVTDDIEAWMLEMETRHQTIIVHTELVPGTLIHSNAREAASLAAQLSPTRCFVQIERGVYFMEARDEVQALRDVDFLSDRGARVLSLSQKA